MTKRLMTCYLLLVTLNLSAQIPDMPLPELIQGEQKLYLDSVLQPAEIENAVYFVYTWYHMNKDVWTLNPKWRKSGFLITGSGNEMGSPGAPVALTGTFKWFTKKNGKLLAQEEFKDGRYHGKTIVYDKKGREKWIYDYDKKWDGAVWSFYTEEFSKGELKHAAFELFDREKGRWKTLCTLGCRASREF